MSMLIIRHKVSDYGKWRPHSIRTPQCRRRLV